ncbi:hypothetical protein CF327_g878 [Tilletia walkeri]|nr:hypothetical protein CF327_g878 [Tilletia walkeri]
MKFTSLLAILALSASVTAATSRAPTTKTLTQTECRTLFATKKVSVSHVTHRSTQTVTRTVTQTSTPVTTITRAPRTVLATVSRTMTFTAAADVKKGVAIITDTETNTIWTITTATSTSTSRVPATTVTTTSTTTKLPPATFTPVNPGDTQRRDLSSSCKRDVSPRQETRQYPRKIICDIDVTKRVSKFKVVLAAQVETVTKARHTTTATMTSTVSRTRLIIPHGVTRFTTATVTRKVTSTSTVNVIATVTHVKPHITERALATYYAACGPINQLSVSEAQLAFTSPLVETTWVDGPTPYDCCVACLTDSKCQVSTLDPEQGCFKISLPDNLCDTNSHPGNYEIYDPYPLNPWVLSNSYCGSWLPY